MADIIPFPTVEARIAALLRQFPELASGLAPEQVEILRHCQQEPPK